jgi:hypothetical protein
MAEEQSRGASPDDCDLGFHSAHPSILANNLTGRPAASPAALGASMSAVTLPIPVN